MVELIERYSCFVVEGEGYITDRLTNLKIIKFYFSSSKDASEQAQYVANACMEALEEYKELKG